MWSSSCPGVKLAGQVRLFVCVHRLWSLFRMTGMWGEAGRVLTSRPPKGSSPCWEQRPAGASAFFSTPGILTKWTKDDAQLKKCSSQLIHNLRCSVTNNRICICDFIWAQSNYLQSVNIFVWAVSVCSFIGSEDTQLPEFEYMLALKIALVFKEIPLKHQQLLWGVLYLLVNVCQSMYRLFYNMI